VIGRIAILTPDRTSEGFRTRWPEVLEDNAAPLRAAGLAVEGRDWAAADDLADFDLVLPLLAWGYPFAPEQWLEATRRWEALGARLDNPPAVLRWNMDKSYLGALAGRGAPVVPTLYVERVLASVDEPLLYARVDLVRNPTGEPRLIELELIEPDLYLVHAADRGGAFAQAVLDRLAS
jgi:hypothetical protein